MQRYAELKVHEYFLRNEFPNPQLPHELFSKTENVPSLTTVLLPN